MEHVESSQTWVHIYDSLSFLRLRFSSLCKAEIVTYLSHRISVRIENRNKRALLYVDPGAKLLIYVASVSVISSTWHY